MGILTSATSILDFNCHVLWCVIIFDLIINMHMHNTQWEAMALTTHPYWLKEISWNGNEGCQPIVKNGKEYAREPLSLDNKPLLSLTDLSYKERLEKLCLPSLRERGARWHG